MSTHPSPALRRRVEHAIGRMLSEYGPQGWWPVRAERQRFHCPNGARELRGYHPNEFDFPKTRKGRWEIICGAVLTQNTAWTNVERALDGLHAAKLITPESVLQSPEGSLGAVIRPAGYFNQKSKYLVAVAEWFVKNDRALCGQSPSRALLEEVRPDLLRVKGVGPETADSILLYAYQLPTFVVDAHTRKVFGRIGVVKAGYAYEGIRALFESALNRQDACACVRDWQEAHALIVEHAKRYHGRRADPTTDFLLAQE